MHVALIKAFDVAEVKLYDWKLAVLLWMIFLSASCLYAYSTPTPIREMDNQTADYASQIQSATTGLCTHRSMEDTSISAAHTNSYNTIDNASYKQGTTITERCNN